MHFLHLTLVAIAWLIALAWLTKLVEAWRGLGTVPNLAEPQYDASPEGEPTLAVIVPARNEAAGVGACVESLLRQDYPKLRMVAVDDRSTDETGAILDALAGIHGERLEVLHVTALPEGWLGKTHAMAVAAGQAIAAGCEFLLFTDADVVFRPDAVRRALARACATEADHFVVLPTTVVKTHGEGMLLSYLQVMALWVVRTWRVADAKAKRDAIGVGAFNLMRASAYRQLGGFEATPMEILEDLTLGRRVKRAGLRQRVATYPGAICLHWAAGVRGILSGMTKNIFAVFRFRPALLLAAAAAIAVGSIGPVCFLPMPGTRVAGLMALASVAGLYALLSRTNGISFSYAALFPIGAALVVYTMLRSMAITMRRGGVDWRGTFYPLAELRKHADGQVWGDGERAARDNSNGG
jgi:glycosyltransferase involved in cell wall biosynthesis